ncbi:diphosphomevalonate decarboxylase [Maribacter sp. 2304DJ31-5]|uniref:diphosphomevalonate decarboxylase n=1 Tax=Maribacter sp. 2304DJ31-5 TaxID=3386273 RepID=UPI0039BD694F
MTEKDFIPGVYPQKVEKGQITYSSPSNIALVKYWGKKENQIPANPSVSFTLEACATTTTVTFYELGSAGSHFSFDLFFEGRPNEDFKPKIQTFFKRITVYLPFLKSYHLKIETANSFPHSSGIASSASGMSALALCLLEIERELNPEMTQEYFTRKASFLARLGSGSACRSIEGDLVQWGAHKETEGSSDLFGIKYPYKVHNVFNSYHDTILLVDKGKKQVSSTIGHGLMHDHPFAAQRFQQAHNNLSKLRSVFEKGDLDTFIEIVESEALTLHAMMMTSQPSFVLMKPNTLEVIQKIRDFREKSGTHVCFTLDAGANVHVLYPENEKEKVYAFVKNELLVYCENQQHICDRIGYGAKKLG